MDILNEKRRGYATDRGLAQEDKKILLVDVDSKIPNLALMSISTFYKKQGYNVELKPAAFAATFAADRFCH